MRILVVIAHYFGQKALDDPRPIAGSQIEPLSRIAALNASLVALHRNFGKISRTFEGQDLSTTPAFRDRLLDIIIKGNSLLEHVGIDPAHYTVEYVDDEPLRIPHHAQRVLRDRAGPYDCYGVMEDDLIIQDEEFFAKVGWFAGEFGPQRLLAPVRFEIAASGTPSKVVVDWSSPEKDRWQFLRPGQVQELSGNWRGQRQTFRIPGTPHAAGYFMTNAQLDYWMKQPSFADGDISWVGPLESAMTLSVGKVFDIYKPADPDPFFLSIEHYGSYFSTFSAKPGQTHGDPPILIIARNAMQAAAEAPGVTNSGNASFDELMGLWRGHRTTAEYLQARNRIPVLESERDALRFERNALELERDALLFEKNEFQSERKALEDIVLEMQRSRSWRITKPLRWLNAWATRESTPQKRSP